MVHNHQLSCYSPYSLYSLSSEITFVYSWEFCYPQWPELSKSANWTNQVRWTNQTTYVWVIYSQWCWQVCSVWVIYSQWCWQVCSVWWYIWWEVACLCLYMVVLRRFGSAPISCLCIHLATRKETQMLEDCVVTVVYCDIYMPIINSCLLWCPSATFIRHIFYQPSSW